MIKRKRTFFFCFPPPDFAGLDDGGGTLSFFGACKMNITIQTRERRNIDLANRVREET